MFIHYVHWLMKVSSNKLSQPLVSLDFEAAGGRIFEWKLAVRGGITMGFIQFT